jgi:hypothetical protein
MDSPSSKLISDRYTAVTCCVGAILHLVQQLRLPPPIGHLPGDVTPSGAQQRADVTLSRDGGHYSVTFHRHVILLLSLQLLVVAGLTIEQFRALDHQPIV